MSSILGGILNRTYNISLYFPCLVRDSPHVLLLVSNKSADPVRDLNNFLQQVQKPTNLVPFLHFNSEQQGPNNQATHTVTYTCQSVLHTLPDLIC